MNHVRSLAGFGKSLSAQQNFKDPDVQKKDTLPDAQKGRSARPQRVKSRGVPSGYVEVLNDVRTPLADFFSILIEISQWFIGSRCGSHSYVET